MIKNLAGKTDVGKIREGNEDVVLLEPELGVFVVADGMGGHKAGEVASAMAAEAVVERFKRKIEGKAIPGPLRGEAFAECIKFANQKVFKEARGDSKRRGMGTTLTCAWIDETRLRVAHVGDSRAYLVREGKMIQLSQDHSLVMEQVREGILTLAEAEKSNYQNILSRAVGTNLHVGVDLYEEDLKKEDLVLLCSDGLVRMLTDKEILSILEEEKNLERSCSKMVEAANEAGGQDNVTVALARLS